MNRYTAKFQTGATITRTSHHKYSCAWAVFDQYGQLFDRFARMRGFSASRELAERAAADALRRANTSKMPGLFVLLADVTVQEAAK